MKYLLDTHILLWSIQNHARLSKKAKDIILNPHHQIVFSTVNIWEVAIKYQKGGNVLEPNFFYHALLERRYQELIINTHHALMTKELPNIHKDHFDRILIAQAKIEGFILMTDDEKIVQYPHCQILIV